MLGQRRQLLLLVTEMRYLFQQTHTCYMWIHNIRCQLHGVGGYEKTLLICESLVVLCIITFLQVLCHMLRFECFFLFVIVASFLLYKWPSTHIALISFRLTTNRISIGHEEIAITLLPRPCYTLAQRWLDQPQISLYLHDTQGPPTLNNSRSPTCTPILSLFLKKNEEAFI